MENKREKIFYHNLKDNVTLSYEDVFNHVVNVNSIETDYSFSTTKDFLLNFITALYYDINITLQDLNKLNEIKKSSIKLVKTTPPHNLEKLIDVVYKSNSKVTLFTSGTTGQPKKITHSVKNLIREVRKGDKFKNNIWGFAYNPTHMAGLQVLFQSFFNCNSLYDVFEFSKEEILKVLEGFKITNISATPTFYRLLIPLEEPLQSLKNVSLGGEKSDGNLYKKIKKSFPNAKILNIYASTEAGTLFSTSGKYFKIISKKSELVKIVDGELLIHRDLLGGKEQDNSSIWYKTGDLVEVVNPETNEFKFTSRKNEMINVGGNKVNPLEIESIIDGIDGVEKSYIYGKPNSILGNMLYARIQLKNKDFTEIQIKQILKIKLENFQIPRKIEFVKSLPLTRTGKLKRDL